MEASELTEKFMSVMRLLTGRLIEKEGRNLILADKAGNIQEVSARQHITKVCN